MSTPKKPQGRNLVSAVATTAILFLAACAALVVFRHHSTENATIPPTAATATSHPAPHPDDAADVSHPGVPRSAVDTLAKTAPGDTGAAPASRPPLQYPMPPLPAPAPARDTALAGADVALASVNQNAPAPADADVLAELTPRELEALEKITDARFRGEVLALAPAARARAFKTLASRTVPDADYASLHVSPGGMLYYVCQFRFPENTATTAAPADSPSSLQPSSPSAISFAPVLISQPPVRHSRPGSRNVLFLDFAGMEIPIEDSNKVVNEWNISAGYAYVERYRAKPYDIDGDPTRFSDQEQRNIIEIWERVAEDFAAFDVDVTTEKPATFTNNTAHALITSGTDKNDLILPAGDIAGGVGFVNVFAESYYASYRPVFIYYDNLGNKNDNAASIAYAVSHELGHNLGLSHDGPGSTINDDDDEPDYGYYKGHGDNSNFPSWAPIMGAGYGKRVIQWSKGDYYNANNHEDDIAIIAGKLGYRPELASTTRATAAPITPLSTGSLGATGIIRHAALSHYHAINLATDATVTLTLDPARLTTSNTSIGSTDLRLELLNPAGATIAANAPTATTNAALTAPNLTSGTYYIRVASEGIGSPMSSNPTGYTDYGSIGQYTLATNLVYNSQTTTPATETKELPPDTGQFTTPITTTSSWTAATDAGWLTLSRTNGTGNATLTITHGANTTGAPRRATLTITTGTTRAIAIAQPALIPLSSALGGATVSALDWQTGGDANWTAQEIVTRAAHPRAARSGIIAGYQQTWLQTTVTGPGVLSYWMKLSTEEEAPSSSGAAPSGDVLRLQIDGSEVAVMHGEQDWARYACAITGGGSHTLRWVYQKNATNTSGADAIWLDEVTWTPGATAALSVTPVSRQMPANASSFSLTVNSSVSWQVTSSAPSWLYATTTTGNGNAGLTINCAANTTTIARTGIITVSGGGGLTATCIVTQSPALRLRFTPGNMKTTAKGGPYVLVLLASATTKWTATPATPWLSVYPTSGTGSARLLVEVASNTANTKRAGTIRATGGALTATGTVTQAAGTGGGNNTGGGGSTGGGGGGGGAPGYWTLLALALLLGLRFRGKAPKSRMGRKRE